MKKLGDEKRLATKNDLKKMRDKILKEDRKEDNKLYQKKSSPRKK
jgi:hypothetical protein